MKRRYANRHVNEKGFESEYKIIYVEDMGFKGDICFYNFNNVEKSVVLPNGLCIVDTGYKWIEFYDYRAKIKLTAAYNEKNEIVEWYFDIAKKIGKEDGVPYEDDLYLDVVVKPSGKTILLDEDELKDALDKKIITNKDYEEAYQVANNLLEKLENNKDRLKEFTDKYLKILMK